MQDDDRENELIWHHSYSTEKVKGVCIERKQETLIFQASLTPPDDVIVQFNNAIPVFMYSPSPPPMCPPQCAPVPVGYSPKTLFIVHSRHPIAVFLDGVRYPTFLAGVPLTGVLGLGVLGLDVLGTC